MIIRNKIAMDIIRKRATAIELQEPVRRIRRKATKLKLKLSTIAVYVSVFALIVVIVFTSYQSPKDSSTVANAVTVTASSVDDVIASSVAANVAAAANLPIANSIANLAVSTRVKNEIMQLNSSSKVLAIGSSVAGRSVTSYSVQAGDTLDALSARFGISTDTIRWANNLTQDALYEGESLQILPVNGVVYDVKFGDTIDSLVAKYGVSRERLILYNDLDVSGLVPNTKVILPDAILPENERPGYIAPISYLTYGYNGGETNYISIGNYYTIPAGVRTYIPQLSSFQESSYGNSMQNGQCTWWAWERRLALGRPIPTPFFGNGGSWGYQLGADKSPDVGDVAESYNHVAVVESINYDSAGNISSITISEMNHGGSYAVDFRTIPASNINDFNYIP